MDVLSRRAFKKDGLDYRVSRYEDIDADVSYLEGHRLAAWERGVFGHIGVEVEISIDRAHWVSQYTLGRASRWGIEWVDGVNDEYVRGIEGELIEEAEGELAKTVAAVCALKEREHGEHSS